MLIYSNQFSAVHVNIFSNFLLLFIFYSLYFSSFALSAVKKKAELFIIMSYFDTVGGSIILMHCAHNLIAATKKKEFCDK